MNRRHDNDASAFPHLATHDLDGNTHGAPGMSLRDYFAAAALTGLCANSFSDGQNMPLSKANEDQMATLAYRQADAMLKAREQ